MSKFNILPIFMVLHILLKYLIGLVKNQKLSANILTPTTKAADHDVPVTPEEVSIPYVIYFVTFVISFA